MPVDLYVGGAEHAVLHLLYARFWHKVLYDLGVVSTKEPFARLVSQGMILGACAGPAGYACTCSRSCMRLRMQPAPLHGTCRGGPPTSLELVSPLSFGPMHA